MALFKSLEIDTLKVRTLLIANPDNSAIPKDFHIYSNGDGKTYWSTGVNASQFISLSTSVSTYENITTNLVINTASTTKGEITSSIVGISSFAVNLSTLALTTAYVNSTLGAFSSQLNVYDASTYTTKASTNLLISDIQNRLLSTQVDFQAQLSSLSTIDTKQQSSIQALFLADSTIYRTLSSYTGSTFAGHLEIISNSYNSTQLNIVSTSNYLSAYTTAINSSLSNGISTLNTGLSSNVSTLNREINNLNSTFQQSISSIYFSSLKYTDISIANIYSSTQTQIINNNQSLSTTLNNTTSSIYSTLTGLERINLSLVSTALIPIQSTNVYLLENLTVLTSTGLTANIYQTFIQLEAYSAGIVQSTVSTANIQINSTITTANNQIFSTISSYNILFANAISVLETSTVNYLINFTSGLTSSYNSSVTAFTSSSINTISTIAGDTKSTQLALFSTTIQTLSSYSAFLFSTTNGSFSTSYFSDYLTSPIITMHRGSNLSTLSNVSSLTGLSSLSASITNLDLTAYKNFQILVSDISSDVYYGLTYNTNTTVTNKEITVQIDMPSSYTNKFVTIDTGNLVKWLGRPKIFNQSAYGLSQKSSPKIFLSTFLGRQIVQMRMMSDALYVKDIYTYPYMYTIVNLTGTINVLSNMTTDNPALVGSTFIYKNTLIPLTWTTNDLNAKLGAKFIGTDENNRATIATSGPYDAALLGANVIVPSKGVFSTYRTIELGVYSDMGLDQSSDSGNVNTNSMVFAVANLPQPIYVFSPSINAKITISNPGNLNSYLQISEVQIINAVGENLMTTAFNKYANTTVSSSNPYQLDDISWGPRNINDGSILSAFRGGIDANVIDRTAFLSVEMSSFTNVLSPQTTLSSIVIYGSGAPNQAFTLTNFVLKVEYNRSTVPGFFYRTVTLNNITPFVLNL